MTNNTGFRSISESTLLYALLHNDQFMCFKQIWCFILLSLQVWYTGTAYWWCLLDQTSTDSGRCNHWNKRDTRRKICEEARRAWCESFRAQILSCVDFSSGKGICSYHVLDVKNRKDRLHNGYKAGSCGIIRIQVTRMLTRCEITRVT